MLPLGLLTAISLLLAPAVFSQTVARKPLPTEPLEKYDNRPAVAAPVLAISPALVSQFGPYTSYQVNVDASGNNRVGDAANEPSICVDRNNPNRMSIGWRRSKALRRISGRQVLHTRRTAARDRLLPAFCKPMSSAAIPF